MLAQRITEAEENYKSRMQRKRTEAEIQRGNEEMIYERRERMKKNMQNTDIKEKNPCIQLNP